MTETEKKSWVVWQVGDAKYSASHRLFATKEEALSYMNDMASSFMKPSQISENAYYVGDTIVFIDKRTNNDDLTEVDSDYEEDSGDVLHRD